MSAPRLAAPERRAGILDAAIVEFARSGFGGTRTATIARAAGVNETLLFRHFGSKQQLYLAAIDEVWRTVRERCSTAFDAEPDAALHWRLMGGTFLQLSRNEPELAGLWVRALSDATGIQQIDEQLARVLEEVHAFAAAAIQRSQRAGGVLADRDVDAEAWIIVSMAMFAPVGQRLGAVAPERFEAMLATHRRWLTGSPD